MQGLLDLECLVVGRPAVAPSVLGLLAFELLSLRLLGILVSRPLFDELLPSELLASRPQVSASLPFELVAERPRVLMIDMLNAKQVIVEIANQGANGFDGLDEAVGLFEMIFRPSPELLGSASIS